MKKAIAIQVGEKRIPTGPEFEKCLWELSKTMEYPILQGFVPDSVETPDIQEMLSWLNTPDSAPDFKFKTEDELKDAGVNPVASAEPAKHADVDTLEESAPVHGSFAGATDSTRAHLLREMIKTRFLNNQPELPGCRDNEVRLGKIYESWGTGLSRTAISRHIRAVVDELVAANHQIISQAGRYRLVPE